MYITIWKLQQYERKIIYWLKDYFLQLDIALMVLKYFIMQPLELMEWTWFFDEREPAWIN